MRTNAVVILMSVFGSMLLSGGSAFAGGHVGGGDSYSLEFTSLARFLAKNWNAVQLPAGTQLSATEFLSVIDKTLVTSEDRSLLPGREVDALNYPAENRIVISRTRWQALKNDTYKKSTIVIHEYLGVLGMDDSHYQISGFALAPLKPILQKLDQISFSNFNLVCTAFSEDEILNFSARIDNEGKYADGVLTVTDKSGALHFFRRLPRGITQDLNGDEITVGLPTFSRGGYGFVLSASWQEAAKKDLILTHLGHSDPTPVTIGFDACDMDPVKYQGSCYLNAFGI